MSVLETQYLKDEVDCDCETFATIGARFSGFSLPLLTVPQQRHLPMFVTGLLMAGCGKLKTIAATVSCPERHHTSLGHFLRLAEWPEGDVLDQAAMNTLRGMKPRRGEVVSLLIDETRIPKRGQKMQALSRM